MTKDLAAPVSRRTVLKGAALGGVATFIAACTGARSSAAPSAAASASAAPSDATASESPSGSSAPQTATGPLMFANWPAYIDLGDAEEYSAGASPTLEQFKAEYGVDVDYQEKIGDNSSFVETIKPALVGGLPTGWDLIVLTDWMASQIVTSG